ncbi:hypothetical protein EVAR_15733_1 [Eumeta japonica]|uniref:Uncharacterized protein n=1 Tax=Eumeta variegata TaxID=151549 RepID=A0A4C1U9S4_EUMVA|nr:hypothetical protein EVAR_15733_1 [Eumeta japonica]
MHRVNGNCVTTRDDASIRNAPPSVSADGARVTVGRTVLGVYPLRRRRWECRPRSPVTGGRPGAPAPASVPGIEPYRVIVIY